MGPQRLRGVGLLLAGLSCLPVRAVTPPGLVYESEKISQPAAAWLLNRDEPAHWKLWTTEEDIDRKRSGGAVLASPAVKADRATPEEGAPPLHSVVADLKPGAYHVWVSGPGRPLAYSLDGRTWTRYEGAELDLGLRELPQGKFEIWIDDRFAHPTGSPGPGYYDYLRFIPVPASATKVRRHLVWTTVKEETARRGQVVPADQCQLKGFEAEGGGRIKGDAVGSSFAHTFDRAGSFYVGLQAVDDVDGIEQLQVTLNGREIATVVGDSNTDTQAVFSLLEPVTVKPGDVLQFTAQTAVGFYRIDSLLLASQPIEPPPPRVENAVAWSPEPGTVHLCWTTNVAMETGVVAYGPVGQAPSQVEQRGNRARNHRAILTGLDPRAELRATITAQAGAQTVTSASIAFRAAPPTPPATKPQRIELTVAEPTAAGRTGWPAEIGLPFAQGQLARVEDLRLLDPASQPVPLQAELFSRWPDGSVKWATLAFRATTAPGAPARYRLEASPQAPASSTAAPTAAVEETADAWRVASDALAFDLGKQVPALFANVGLDRNGDGRVADDERLGAKPLGANLKVDAADGSFLTCGPPERFSVEQNGPVRAILRWSGPLVSPQGPAGWSYLVRVTIYRGLPTLRVNVSLCNEAQEPRFRAIRAFALRVPLDATGGVRGGFDGAALTPVPDDDGLWLLQEQESRSQLRTAGAARPGGRAVGVAAATDDRTRVTVAFKDFWQAYPSGFSIKRDGVHVRLLPALPADIYRDEPNVETWLRLYAWCREGQYVLKAGQLLQREVLVRYDAAGATPDAVKLAGWYGAPLVPQAPPAYLCATGVLGRPVFPRTPGVWDRYETYFEQGFQNSLADRDKVRTYGFMHWGDWFGERIFNYGNNEYDLPWGLAVQWMRTGDPRYLARGEAMARHYSTIDTLWSRSSDGANGLCYEHSFNHVGADLARDDPRLQQGQVARYLQEFGGGMFSGAIDRQGHVFQPGNWFYAALTGDPWFRDAAERVCLNQAEKLTPAFDFGIERAGGWPLINMSLAYGFSGNPFYLNAARLMIERTLQRQDPVTGGWPHRPPLDETDGEPVMGGKAFAVGILSHGILRYLDVEPEPRPEVANMLVRGADWLMNESWCPGKGFRYISNSKKYLNSGSRGGTSLLNAELVAFAHEQTKDRRYLDFWREMMEGQLDGSPSGNGKSYAMTIRQTVFGLDRVRAAGVVDAPRPAKVVMRQQATLEQGVARFAVLVDNPSPTPQEAVVEVVGGATGRPVRWSAGSGVSLSPPVELRGGAGTATVEIRLTGAGPLRRTVTLAAAPPAAAGPRGTGVAYVGPVESATRRGLVAAGQDLPAIADPATADLRRHAGLIVAGDSWKSPTVDLPAAAPQLVAFARGGGRLAIFQINDDSWDPGWLPADLFAFDADTSLGQLVRPTHPLFTLPQAAKGLERAWSYDSLGPVAAPWEVLATDAAGQPAIIEAVVGAGRIMVIEPSLDRYAAGAGDAPDDAVKPAAAIQFLKNLVTWLGQP